MGLTASFLQQPSKSGARICVQKLLKVYERVLDILDGS